MLNVESLVIIDKIYIIIANKGKYFNYHLVVFSVEEVKHKH